MSPAAGCTSQLESPTKRETEKRMQRLKHITGGALTSAWFANSFIMVAYENFFLSSVKIFSEFSVQSTTKNLSGTTIINLVMD